MRRSLRPVVAVLVVAAVLAGKGRPYLDGMQEVWRDG